MPKKTPIFEDTRSPDFKNIYTTGVFGGISPDDARITFFIDRVEIETLNEPVAGMQKVKKILREALMEVHMTPTQFKRIGLWIMTMVQDYEKTFGTIPLHPKSKLVPKPTKIDY